MKSLRLTTGVASLLLLLAASPSFAADGSWSLIGGLGIVDQEAIGGTANVAVGLERRLNWVFFLDLMGGYFAKDDRDGTRRDTTYGVAVVTLRCPRQGVQPFVQAGGGRYVFESHNQSGWLGGLGVDFLRGNRFTWSVSARYHSVERPENGPLPDFKELQLGVRMRL